MFTKNRNVVKSFLKPTSKRRNAGNDYSVNRGDLEKALLEPENYKHLFVRVGGFTASL